MRTLYNADLDDLVEGMFDSDGTLLSFWSPNDATWRQEYFRELMEKLGYHVKTAPEWMRKKLFDKANECWGPFDVGYEDFS